MYVTGLNFKPHHFQFCGVHMPLSEFNAIRVLCRKFRISKNFGICHYRYVTRLCKQIYFVVHVIGKHDSLPPKNTTS